MSAEGKYVECNWYLGGRRIVLSGRINGDEVRALSAEDLDGNPVCIPEPFIVDAVTDLIEAAKSSFGAPRQRWVEHRSVRPGAPIQTKGPSGHEP